jgi:hypothetical protein
MTVKTPRRSHELNALGTDFYRALLYKGRPVKTQRRAGNRIRWRDYQGNVEFVSERAWQEHTREVLVPKKLGAREFVLKNWEQYGQLEH